MGAAVVVVLFLAALSAIYGPETVNLVNSGPIERDSAWTEKDILKEIQECFQERERRRNEFNEANTRIEITAEPLWTFVPDDEVRYELWKERDAPLNFDRVRAARAHADRLLAAISNEGETFGIETFPDRKYLLLVDRVRRTTVDDQEIVTSSGALRDSYGDTGDWRITTSGSIGSALGTINAPDSWIRIRGSSEDESLTVFGEIDQCRRAQALREMANDITPWK